MKRAITKKRLQWAANEVLQLYREEWQRATAGMGREAFLAELKTTPKVLRQLAAQVGVFFEAIGATLSVPTAPKYWKLGDAVSYNDEVQVLEEIRKGVNPDARINGVLPILWRALEQKHYGIVKILLDAGANPNTRRYGKPILAEAIEEHPLSVARALLKAGADPNAKDITSYEPVLSAVRAGGYVFSRGKYRIRTNIMALKLLIRYNVNLNVLCNSGKILNPYRDRITILNKAVKAENLDVVKIVLEGGADPNRQSNLEDAVKSRNIEIVRLLLVHGADPNAKTGNDYDSILWQAIKQGNSEDIARELLAAGANPRIHVKTSFLSWSRPLLEVVEKHYPALAEDVKCACETYAATLPVASSEAVDRTNTLPITVNAYAEEKTGTFYDCAVPVSLPVPRRSLTLKADGLAVNGQSAGSYSFKVTATPQQKPITLALNCN